MSKIEFVIREHFADAKDDDTFVSLDAPFPLKGFIYFEPIERATRFNTIGAAAAAIAARNQAMGDDPWQPFSIVPVKVTTSPATRELRVVELGTYFRLVNGVIEMAAFPEGPWSESRGWSLETSVGTHTPDELRMFADLIEQPYITVPGSTTITLA